jgi:hypothetical protein
MSLGKQMIEQLRLLPAAATPPSDVPVQALVVNDEAGRATLEFVDHDRYSVTMRALQVGASAPAGETRAYLSSHAAEIARSLSYLEEPLAVWELDGGERVAQLRSSPPLREGDEVSYWEVTLSAGAEPGARLQRYHWAPGMVEREELDYPATFALVGRLADSLAAALCEAKE